MPREWAGVGHAPARASATHTPPRHAEGDRHTHTPTNTPPLTHSHAELQAALARRTLTPAQAAALAAASAAAEREAATAARARASLADFDIVADLGRGAFGAVRLARDRRAGGALVALKSLNKADMVARGQVGHARDERNALAALAASPRVVALRATFQDEDALHLVLEYLPGGDLMTLLMRMDVVPVVSWCGGKGREGVGKGKRARAFFLFHLSPTLPRPLTPSPGPASTPPNSCSPWSPSTLSASCIGT